MGVVWKAWDPSLARMVALKLLREDALADGDSRVRFQREARAAAKLHHPGIVAVHDVGEVDGRLFLTMQFVPGRSFDALLSESREARRAGAPAEADLVRRAVTVLAEVAAAVAHAHEQGVVHRDLKPANILLDLRDRPAVTDFGLAKEIARADQTGASRLTHTGDVMGTPAYMSPEQAEGDLARIGPACDVLALGAMLYEALTGATPFEGKRDVHDLLRAVIRDDPLPPSTRHPGAARGLDAVCLEALEKAPAQRYRTAREFAAELRRWLDGRPVEARRPGAGARAWRWMMRRKAATLPLAGAALVLFALALGSAWYRADRSAHLRGMLDSIARAVGEFEEALRTTRMDGESQQSAALQPLTLLDRLAGEEPGFGPIFAWRGRVLALLRRKQKAHGDFDRGCELSPGHAVVWYLRGVFLLQEYSEARGLPMASADAGGLRPPTSRPRPAPTRPVPSATTRWA